MANFRNIGVLGGMGPQATILLQQRLLSAITADDDASHVPLLIDMNPQIPSRIKRILDQTGDDPGPVLADMARRLEVAGASALIMPCNTAHYYASEIASAVNIPLLHMIEMTGEFILRTIGSGTRIGILASPATQKINLFTRVFAQQGLDTVYPDQSDALLAAIRRIKSRGPRAQDQEALSTAARNCREQGANCLLVGCTEFSLLADTLDIELPIVDTLDVLVMETVRFATAG